MIILPLQDAPKDQPVRRAPRNRRCLRCREEFHSEWAGERICTRCKGTSAWKEGTPIQAVSSGGRRG